MYASGSQREWRSTYKTYQPNYYGEVPTYQLEYNGEEPKNFVS
jgi:hypothetical protein